jgi:hypothetical protein
MMKTHRVSLPRTCGIILLAATLCWAQQPAASVSNLREQIQQLESIDRDPATSDDVKTLNRRFLNERRSLLRTVLQQRIETLRKYQTTVKTSLTAEENKIVEDSIVELEKEVRDLDREIKASQPGASATRLPSSPSSEETTNGPGPLQPAGTSAIMPTPAGPAPTPTPQKVSPVTAATCSGSTNPYEDAPPLLKDAVERTADDIISGAQKPVDAISAKFDDMFLYAVAHAVAPGADTSVASIKSLKAYQYLGETVRTDKQVGAPAKAAGTTSAIEKPGFARLLGFAVENGAIIQDVGKTSLTLSTSPYLLYTFRKGGDTAENYQKAGILNRIGMSATFNLNNQDNVLANATRNQLSQWSIKARLFGDRSTRSQAFQDFWNKPGGPRDAIQGRLNAVTQAFTRVSPGFAPEFAPFTNVETDLGVVVGAVTSSPSYTAGSPEKKKQLLTNASLCVIRNEVYNPITTKSVTISASKKDEINLQIIPAIAASLNNIESVRKLLNDKLEEFQKGPLATFAYVNHRTTTGSDYSEGKFLYSHESTTLSPMKLVANVGMSFYHKPNRAMNQQTARDFSVGLSF